MEETYSKLNSTQKIVVKLLQELITESTDQPTLKSLLHINRLQSLPAFYQPAPRINQPTGFSTSWPLFISGLFTGLSLMTGLIMCSP